MAKDLTFRSENPSWAVRLRVLFCFSLTSFETWLAYSLHEAKDLLLRGRSSVGHCQGPAF